MYKKGHSPETVGGLPHPVAPHARLRQMGLAALKQGQTMRTQSPDTSPEAERGQIELLRNMSMAQRMSRVRSLTEIARRTLRRCTGSGEAGFSWLAWLEPEVLVPF